MAEDAAQKNIAGYKGQFTAGSQTKDFVKHSPFRFVDGMSGEQRASLGLGASIARIPMTNPMKASQAGK